MTVLVGTSGWQYRDWRGGLYPSDLAQARWLPRYAECFPTVEVNATFYRLQAPGTFDRWGRATPEGFVFALKASRYLTHVRRLQDPGDPVDTFLERARRLGGKLGPILLQLPPTMRADVPRLAAALDCFPDGMRVAVEPRHPSWFCTELERALGDRDVALCLADRAEEAITPLWRTSSWSYVRLHEGTGSPRPGYRPGTLRRWVEHLLATWGAHADGYVYFNNDTRGCAPRDARRFIELAEKAGLDV